MSVDWKKEKKNEREREKSEERWRKWARAAGKTCALHVALLCRGAIIKATAGTILQMDDCVRFLYVIVHVPVKADNTY